MSENLARLEQRLAELHANHAPPFCIRAIEIAIESARPGQPRTTTTRFDAMTDAQIHAIFDRGEE